MSKREEFKKFYDTARELGIEPALAAEFIPSASEVQRGQNVLTVAFERLSKANEWIGPHVRNLQNGVGRSAHRPSATI